jgi:hypothetical protein
MNLLYLFRVGGSLIAARMHKRFLCFMTVALLLALPAVAQSKKTTAPVHTVATAAVPKLIGKFDDWTAATHAEGGETVCYAFTRVQSSVPTLPGRGPVILTVTERSSGRDSVAIEAGLSYPANSAVTLQVDQAGLEFYTSGRNAFARDGKAVVAAFGKAGRAISRFPGPKEVTDTFSLKGFGAAHAAIVKACPAK